MPQLNSAGRYAHIDAMRAISVILVVLGHVGIRTGVDGAIGVTIFFCISGFIISYAVMREFDRTHRFSFSIFYKKRFWKLFPPLFVAVAIPSLVWLIAGGSLNLKAFLGEIFFFYNWIAITLEGGVLPGTGVVWSLSVEEQFYIAFAILWAWAIHGDWKKRLMWVAIAAFVFSTVLRIYIAINFLAHQSFSSAPTSSVWERRIYFGTDTRMDAIALGISAAILLHHSENGCPRAHALVRVIGSDSGLLVAGLMIFLSSRFRESPLWHNTGSYSLVSIAAFIGILYGFAPESRLKYLIIRFASVSPIQLVGLASYSIYIVHHQIILLLSMRFSQQPSLLFAAGILTGLALYYAIERPVLKISSGGH